MKSIVFSSAVLVMSASAAFAQVPSHDNQGGHGGVSVQLGNAGYTGDHGRVIRQHATNEHYQSYQDPGFRAEIGSTLPGSAALHPLPDGIVSGLPSARGHQYSIVNDRYVVVDPSNRRVIHSFD